MDLSKSLPLYSFHNSRLLKKEPMMIWRTVHHNKIVCKERQITKLTDFENILERNHQ